MKPVGLVAQCIVNSTAPNGTVLDPFGGSGSTLIACEQTGRKCRMMEIDPRYVDVIITRWENLTGKKAKLLK
jgi:DNA modification methylase